MAYRLLFLPFGVDFNARYGNTGKYILCILEYAVRKSGMEAERESQRQRVRA